MSEDIAINDNLYLNQIEDQDAHDLVKAISHRRIVDNTLQVPFPYKLSDAISWIRFVETLKQRHGHLTNWAIRSEKRVVGGIGLLKKHPEQPHCDELGYWLTPALWNQGIMTRVVNTFSGFLFEQRALVRLEAPVFSTNIGSQRVLEKCGFTCEGLLRKAYKVDMEYRDVKLYAKIKV